MNLDKKQWTMLIAGVVALFLVYWLFFRKKKTTESGYDDAVMIMGDSSYDPAFPELGGRDSGFAARTKCLEWTMGANGKVYCSKYSSQTGTARLRNDESSWKMAPGDKCYCPPTEKKDKNGNTYTDCDCKGWDAKDKTIIYPA